MAVNDTLSKLEEMVVNASHLPFTDKTLINDNDLIHYIDELRNDIPKALARAEEIERERDTIIDNARRQAEDILAEATNRANILIEDSEIVIQAKQRAQHIQKQSEEQAREVLMTAQENAARLQENADDYANQVFDQLIMHVGNTYQNVEQAEQGLQQALTTLRTARAQMNQPPDEGL